VEEGERAEDGVLKEEWRRWGVAKRGGHGSGRSVSSEEWEEWLV
jgi:hypothetical protein